LEQLIPLDDLARFGITSRTPLPAAAAAAAIPFSPHPTTKGCLEIINDPKVIREFLVARGIKPRAKELVSQMQEYAKRMNQRLVLLSRPSIDGKANVAAYDEGTA
jgi:hypothetical protein